MTVRIVTDSACDLPQKLIDDLGITVVPLSIRFGDEEFVDRRDLTVDEFWRRCQSAAVLPSTAAPAPGQFAEAYRTLANSGATGILVVNISGKLSATMQSAELGAKQAGVSIPVEIVDTASASMGIGLVAVAVAKAARNGASLADLVTTAKDLSSRTQVWAALDTLENLKKNGRIGGAKAMLATALSIKPIITVTDGAVGEGGKQRTRGKALAFLVDRVREAGRIESLAILHAQCPDVQQFTAMIREVYSGDITVGDIGAVIGAHAGPGTIGVAFHVAR